MQNIKITMKAIEFTRRFIKKAPLADTLHLFPKAHLLAVGGLSATLLVTAVAAYSTKSPEYATRNTYEIPLSLTTDQSTAQTSETLAIRTLAAPQENTATATISTIEQAETTSISTTQQAIQSPIQTETTAAQETHPIKVEPLETFIDWHIETVKQGDNLSLLFQRAGLSDVELYRFLSSSKDAAKLKRIYPGQEISFHVDNGQLAGLRYQKNRLEHVEFSKTEKGFSKETTSIQPDIKVAYREATILNSLFLAGTDAGIEEGVIMELASIFGWDVDFALDIRTNDSFKVMYEEQFVDGKKIGNGAILAAEFTNQNRTYKAVRYTDSNGDSEYYTPEGKSMRKAFLRTPVDFARISSHFNLKRKHPILNRIRAHKGTDYAAPTGTPIKAAGNGKVEFAGTKGGYGRTVVLRHGQSYKTLYAHLHKYGKGIRNGTRVKQGQIIGYVGKSGLATGPHLHYEFYKNGVVRNPVRVKLPKAQSVPKSQLADFQAQTQPLVASIQQYAKKTQLALSGSGSSATN